ncbi:MAG: radical SAM protein [Thermoplasmata archaeon]|nr:radical SAM protein [Thermoplasmata archaeon]
MIRTLAANSKYTGSLPKGCVHCKSGRKLVLFVTGKCYQNCVYCPISIEKRGRDAVWANELLVEDDGDVLYEAKMIGAVGAGITGGEPALVMERVKHYNHLLKTSFPYFHTHLYTTTHSPEIIGKFEDAGVDELRFHIPVKYWENLAKSPYAGAIRSALNTRMCVGIEVPAFPNKAKELGRLLKDGFNLGIEFVNLNELEFSDTNWEGLRRLKIREKGGVSAAAKGSEEVALRMLREFENCRVHYCSSAFKDAVQLRKRLLRRAKNVAKPYEVITEEGTLLRGVIYAENPLKLKQKLIEEFKIPANLVEVVRGKNLVLTHPGILEEIAEELDGKAYIVEVYPTEDGLEVERIPL